MEDKTPKHCNQIMTGIEYWYKSPNHYDGVSEWRCDKCNYRQGRWSGKALQQNKEELRYGG